MACQNLAISEHDYGYFPDPQHYDEMAVGNELRPHYRRVGDWLSHTPLESLLRCRQQSETFFRQEGITFTVYGESAGTERLIPYDIMPRIIPHAEWELMAKGCEQRVRALNAFLHDIYHEQHILKAGIVPREFILGNEHFQPAMQGLDLPNRIYAQISGIDIVRHSDGTHYVLEDNLRTPSGVSYMLENRAMTERLFPGMLAENKVLPVDHYPALLKQTLLESSRVDNPNIVILTPGRFNSAYFEHAFLAREMGVPLVGGGDLVVYDNTVFMKTDRKSVV